MKTKSIICLLITYLIVGFSCQTDDNLPPKTTDPNNPSVPVEDIKTEVSDDWELNPDAKEIRIDDWTQNVSVLDSINGNLQMDQSLIRKYNLKPGSIIVSCQGEGFLRKIKSINESADKKANIETEFCTLAELIKQGSFSVSANYKNLNLQSMLRASNSELPIDHDFSFLDITGKYTIGSQIQISGSFDPFEGLKAFSLSITLTNQLELTAGLKASGSIKKKICEIPLPPIVAPITVTPVMVFYLGGEITGKFSPLDFNFLTGFNATANISYDGQWSSSCTKNYFCNYQIPSFTLNDKSNVKVKVFIEGEIQFKVFGVLAPYFSVEGAGQIEAAYAGNPAWTAYRSVGMSGGVKAKILTKDLFDFKVNFFEVKNPLFFGENYLSISSGNGQQGVSGKKLPKPLVAQVTNTFGYPLSGYKVQFKSTAGGGKLSRTEATTNADGEASVELTLNSDKNVFGHEVEASAIEKNDTPHKGKPLKESPVTFFASVWNEDIYETIWTFELKSSKSTSKETISCLLKENGVAQIGTINGSYSINNNSLTINWVARTTRPPGCTYQLRGTMNGTSCSGTYTHWDYDAKGVQSVYDSGTFTGYLSSVIE